LILDADGSILPFDNKSIGQRSQDLVETYHDAGQFYWGRASAFLNEETRVFGARSRMKLLPSYMVADIDTLADWERAEVLYDVLKKQGKL